MGIRAGRHACPGLTCGLSVDDRLFCCYQHWHALSQRARRDIGATAGLSLLALPRRRAIEAALKEWRA